MDLPCPVCDDDDSLSGCHESHPRRDSSWLANSKRPKLHHSGIVQQEGTKASGFFAPPRPEGPSWGRLGVLRCFQRMDGVLGFRSLR